MLNHKIILHMVYLILDCNYVFALTQRKPEKSCKGRNSMYCFRLLFIFNLPNYDIQCIVEKMRVNLCLKRIKFTLSLLLVLIYNVLHEPLYPKLHILNRLAQVLYLVRATHVDISIKIALFKLLYRLFQLSYRIGYPK